MGCCSVGGCLCALRAQGWVMYIFLDMHFYWIYFANNCGVLFTWGVSVCTCQGVTCLPDRTSARGTSARLHARADKCQTDNCQTRQVPDHGTCPTGTCQGVTCLLTYSLSKPNVCWQLSASGAKHTKKTVSPGIGPI